MDGYMSARDAAKRWNITDRQVQKMCSEGMIPKVVRFGRSWVIPEDAEKPTRTGKLKPGRKPQNDSPQKE